MQIEPGKNSYFSDLYDESVDCLLSPLKICKDKSFLSITKVIKPISKFFRKIADNIYVALFFSFQQVYLFLGAKWEQQAITVAGGNGKGMKLNQLYLPCGIFIINNQSIYVAALLNHRIVRWKCNEENGRIVAGKNGRGNKTDQLDFPTDVVVDKQNKFLIISDSANRRVMRWTRQSGEIIIEDIDCYGIAIDKNGYLYVSDYAKHEVRRWGIGDQDGKRVAGGNGKGNHFNQLNHPTYIFVDDDYSLYISDTYNHRVMKWVKDATEGILVAGGNDSGDRWSQLSNPYGVIVDQCGQIYVADSNNNRVMCWIEGQEEGSVVVGGNGYGDGSDQLNSPRGLSFDLQGNLYVADGWNNRVQMFELN